MTILLTRVLSSEAYINWPGNELVPLNRDNLISHVCVALVSVRTREIWGLGRELLTDSCIIVGQRDSTLVLCPLRLHISFLCVCV